MTHNNSNNNTLSLISKVPDTALQAGTTFLFFDADHQEIQCAIRLDVKNDQLVGVLRSDSLLLDRVRCGCRLGFRAGTTSGHCSFSEGPAQGKEIEVAVSFDSFNSEAPSDHEGAVPRT